MVSASLDQQLFQSLRGQSLLKELGRGNQVVERARRLLRSASSRQTPCDRGEGLSSFREASRSASRRCLRAFLCPWL